MSTAASSLNMSTKFLNGAVQGLALAVASNTTLTVGSGSCMDSTNATNMILSSSATINAANNGANGLDTGSLAASTWYYVFLISSSVGAKSVATIISTSSSSPTLPTGYDAFRLIGFALTDGSVHFLTFYQIGNGNLRRYVWDTNISVLSNGTATSLTAIDCSGGVPIVDNTMVKLEVDFTPATANDKVSFAPYGSTATVLPHVTGSVAAKVNSSELMVLSKLNSSLPKVLYINSAASGSTNAWVSGFDHYI